MFKRIRRRATAGLMAIAIVMSNSLITIQPAAAAPGDPQVTICHATNSTTNPYTTATVDPDSIDGVGNGDHYSEHTGPVL